MAPAYAPHIGVPAAREGRFPGVWKRELRRAPARVQWDPERDLHARPLEHRSLQLGLSGEAAARYADEWIVGITDVTPLARTVHAHVREGELAEARRLLPVETPYPVAYDGVTRVLPRLAHQAHHVLRAHRDV
uniref:DUF4291 family protein n=1 Tax=Streptomyces corallincola TaxID=2851888 RepID=UPI001FE6DC0F|nr:DUF4291 family protein [Streptomyces corallincola]